MQQRGEETKEKIITTAMDLVMDRGFAGTSVDEIIKGTGLTKGAFFHHFSSKMDLAEALLNRYAEEDLELFVEFAAQADAKTDDPLERVLLFLTLFEDNLKDATEPFQGCMFASYIYEGQQFSPRVHAFIETALKGWGKLYEDKFEAVLAAYTPKLQVTAPQLAETIVCLMEGAFLMAKARNDTGIIIRQSFQFRKYLEFLFEKQGSN